MAPFSILSMIQPRALALACLLLFAADGTVLAADLDTQLYTVLPGDTLRSIAERYETTVGDLCAGNDGLSSGLYAGQVLHIRTQRRVRPRRRAYVRVKEGETVGSVARRFNLTSQQVRWLNQITADAPPVEPGRMLLVLAEVDASNAGVDEDGRVFRSRLAEPTPMGTGMGFILKNAQNAWGTRHTVEILRRTLDSVRRAFPDAPPLVIGDLSRRFGGRLSPHVSHRRGNDVDIALPLRSGDGQSRFRHASAGTLDVPRTWEMIRSSVATGRVEYVFIDYRLQESLREYAASAGLDAAALDELFQAPRGRGARHGIIRHARGHRDHLHIRFRHDKPQISEYLAKALTEAGAGMTTVSGVTSAAAKAVGCAIPLDGPAAPIN